MPVEHQGLRAARERHGLVDELRARGESEP
jgi:hypothetical protein